MELGCALMENLIQLFDEELFQNQNLQCPIVSHAMTRFKSLSSREMVESPKERLTRISKETRRELEEREEKEEECNSCKLRRDVRELQGMKAWTSKGFPPLAFIVFQPSLFVNY
ncbi:hypothetical protein AAC387_Pa01g2572 [Persea americana]